MGSLASQPEFKPEAPAGERRNLNTGPEEAPRALLLFLRLPGHLEMLGELSRGGMGL